MIRSPWRIPLTLAFWLAAFPVSAQQFFDEEPLRGFGDNELPQFQDFKDPEAIQQDTRTILSSPEFRNFQRLQGRNGPGGPGMPGQPGEGPGQGNHGNNGGDWNNNNGGNNNNNNNNANNGGNWNNNNGGNGNNGGNWNNNNGGNGNNPPPANPPQGGNGNNVGGNAPVGANGAVGSAIGGLLHALAFISLGVIVAMIVYFIVQAIMSYQPNEKLANQSLAAAAPNMQGEIVPDKSPGEVPADVYVAEAERLAREGRYREALAHLILGAMSQIERQGLIKYRQGMTHRDYVRAVRGQGAVHQSIRGLVKNYEPIGFGRRQATDALFRESMNVYKAGFSG